MKLNLPKVENMTSNRGNAIPNKFVITTKNGQVFQSYQTIIAYKRNKDGKIFLDNNYDCSVTTGKYRNQFLGEALAETRRKIECGIYKVVDLNS